MVEEGSECPVCFKKLGDKNIFITNCGHVFCGNCIVANIKFTDKCPMCRQNITDSSSGEVFPRTILADETYRRYTGLIIENVRNILELDTSMESVDIDFFRQELTLLLQAFQTDIERSETNPIYGRRFSISDIPYDPVDEIMANMEIPE